MRKQSLIEKANRTAVLEHFKSWREAADTGSEYHQLAAGTPSAQGPESKARQTDS